MFKFLKNTKNKLKTNFNIHTAEFVALKEVVKNTDQLIEKVDKEYTYKDFIKENKGELNEGEFVRQCLSNQRKILLIYGVASVFTVLGFVFTLHPITFFLSMLFLLKSLVYFHKIKQLQEKRLFPIKDLFVSAFRQNNK